MPSRKEIKHPKHDFIIDNLEMLKRKKLERLATKLIKDKDKVDNLKKIKIDNNFLKHF